MNSIFLTGRIANDLKLEESKSGTKYVRFAIAVKRDYKVGDDYVTDFIDCITYRAIAENICKYCFKGQKLAVTGKLETSTYDNQNGGKTKTTNVIIESLEFLEAKHNE